MEKLIVKNNNFEELTLEESIILDGGKSKTIVEIITEGMNYIYNYFN